MAGAGLIEKPQSVRDRESREIGAGWIVGVGARFGNIEYAPAPHPQGLVCDSPEDALCLHVFFGLWTGKPFMAAAGDDEWGSTLVVLTDRDVQAVDFRPETYEPKEIKEDDS
jgi:hypothetical protein